MIKNEFVIDSELALQFDAYMKKYKQIYESFAKLAKKYLPEYNKNSVILDIGMGSGLLIVELSKKFPEAKIIGIDPSPNMLKLALEKIKQNNCKNCKTYQVNVEKIPLDKDSVDLVISRLSISSWSDKKLAFNEIYRVLKPDGKLILEGLNKDFSRFRLFVNRIHMNLNHASKKVINYHIKFYNKALNLKEIESLLVVSNFRIVRTFHGEKKDWNYIIIAKKQ